MFRIIALFLPWIQGGCVGPQGGEETKKPCDPKKFMEEYHRRHAADYYSNDAGTTDAGTSAVTNTDAGSDAEVVDVYIGTK